jgi:hypothetical protein
MKLILEENNIKELEQMIQEMPYKYAQPLLGYLAKFVIQDESTNLEEKKDGNDNGG